MLHGPGLHHDARLVGRPGGDVGQRPRRLELQLRLGEKRHEYGDESGLDERVDGRIPLFRENLPGGPDRVQPLLQARGRQSGPQLFRRGLGLSLVLRGGNRRELRERAAATTRGPHPLRTLRLVVLLADIPPLGQHVLALRLAQLDAHLVTATAELLKRPKKITRGTTSGTGSAATSPPCPFPCS